MNLFYGFENKKKFFEDTIIKLKVFNPNTLCNTDLLIDHFYTLDYDFIIDQMQYPFDTNMQLVLIIKELNNK